MKNKVHKEIVKVLLRNSIKISCSLFFVLIIGCKPLIGQKNIYRSEGLVIEQLTKNTFVHISYLEAEDFGKVACNGMVVIDNNEAIVYDTAVDNTVSLELIDWITTNMKSKIKAIVVTHFHMDCLGGLFGWIGSISR